MLASVCFFFLSRLLWIIFVYFSACVGVLNVSVMRECLLVLAPVVFNPYPEVRISSSLSHRLLLSLAEHLAMRAIINIGMAILSVTEGGMWGERFTLWGDWRWGPDVSMRGDE